MIHLYFDTAVVPLDDAGQLTITRLNCNVTFRRQDGTWSRLHVAIIDSGAHTSVLPEKIWREAERDIIAEYELKGINPRPECSIPALVGKVMCMLHDDYGHSSDDLLISAILAQSNEVPIILGFADLLTEFEVTFNYRAGRAYLSPMEV